MLKLTYTDRGKKRTIYIECSDRSPGIAFASEDVGPEEVSQAGVSRNLFDDLLPMIEKGDVIEVWHES